MAARPLLGGTDGDQPAGGQRPPAAGHARRAAVRPRPRLHRRRRDRTRSLHARPQGARPAGHARHRLRRDRLGRRQRSPRPAGHVGVRRRRGRADAAARRVDPAHHAADPRREGRRRDSRRDPLPLGHRRLDPPRRRESRSGAVGTTDRAAGVVGARYGALARGPVFRTARHRSAPRAGVRRTDPHRPPTQRHLGDRDRAARRGDRPPRIPHPPGAARRGAAGPGRRAVQRIVGRRRRGHLSSGVVREDPGVRRGRASRPVPRRVGQPGRRRGRHQRAAC